MKRFIYADNAATTKLDEVAFEVMKPYLFVDYGNPSQPYSFARSAKEALKRARQTIADCINAEPDEIYFTSGGTESDNWAIKGIALSPLNKKATIISQIEHHAVLNSCKTLESLGYPVAYLRVDKSGTVQPQTLKNIITDNTRLVSIMTANNEIGTIQPIKELASVAHEYGAIFHTDAVQAVGHIKIDVKDLGVDLLSASAHKFNGPKGMGFLYIKNGTKISPYLDGGSQQNGLRAGTENVAVIVGMAAALKNNCDNLLQNSEHICSLENRLINRLNMAGIDYVKNGSPSHIPGNVSLSFKDKDGEAILHRLDLMGISISTGAACDSVNTQVSHVINAIGLQDEYALGTIRISLGKYNTAEEVDCIVEALRKVL